MTGRERDVLEVIRSNVVDIVDGVAPEQVEMKADLKDLGADSLDRAEIAWHCIEDLGVDMLARDLANVTRVDEIVKILRDRWAR